MKTKMKRVRLTIFLTTLLMLMGTERIWGQTTASIDFSNQGYANAQEITSAVIDDNVSVTFDKGTNSNAPKYYNSGTAIRCYGGNFFTVACTSGNLTDITLTFGSSDGSNAITTDVESFVSPTWTGEARSVTFTIGGTSGNRRIMGISVTYSSGISQPTCAIPTFDPAGGMYNTPQNVTINCETDGATIYFTTDGTTPNAASSVFTSPIVVSSTTTIKAMAMKDGYENSVTASETYVFKSLISIAEARLLNANEYAFVEGIVTFIDGRNVYIQDATAGIDLFLNSGTVPTDLAIGDAVSAYGKKTTYSGLIELTGINGGNSDEFAVISSGNDLPVATKTIAEILDDYNASNALQSTRVRIENAVIGTINTNGSTTLTQDENVLNIYKVPALDGISEGDNVNVTGVVGCYNAPQLRVAYATDVENVIVVDPCATPTFDPEAGTYSSTQNVSLACATDGASIHYTLDGTVPTESSPVFSTPIEVAETTTIKAMAVKDGFSNSSIAEATYIIEMPFYTFNKLYAHTAVTDSDAYMIVDMTSDRALTWANGSSSAPTAVPVTIENDQITCNNGQLFWNIKSEADGYVIHPANDDTRWLYSTNSNNGVRVGTNTAKYWTLDVTDETKPEYHGFQHNETSRYMGVYNNQDWRTYTSIHNNIQSSQIEIFILGDAPVPQGDPEIAVSVNGFEDFTYEQGEGPSAAQTFNVSGSNLLSDINLTASENFEISIGDDYVSSLSIPSIDGDIEAVSVNVRMVSGLTMGTYSGSLVVSSQEVSSLTLPLNGEVTISNAVAQPVFTPVAGMYLTAQTVSIATETEGASIYYTLDGTEPTENSLLYEEPLMISANTTIKAIGIRENYINSLIATAEYAFPTMVTIAEARALANNEYAFVEGIVTFIDGRNVYIEDATGGIDLYLDNNTVPATLTLGDEVRAYGRKTVFSGLVELTGINGSSASAFVVGSTGNDLPIHVRTIEEVNTDYNNDNMMQATRIKIEGAIIGAINPSGNTLIRQGNNTLNVYRIPVVEGMIQGDWVSLTGVVSCYNGPQLRVAYAEDVEYTHRPTLAASPTTVSGLSYQYGQGPSDISGFLLSGDYLEDMVFIEASESFEISTMGGSLFMPENPIRIIPPQSGQFNSLKIYCRLKAGLEIGTYNELQTLYTADADTIYVRFIGSVTEQGGGGSDDYVRIASLDELSVGQQVVFAARFNENANEYYAMTSASSGKPEGILFTSETLGGEEILPVSITSEETNFYWTVGMENGNYTFTNAGGEMIGYTSSTNFSTGGENVAWAISMGTSDPASMVPDYTAFNIINVNSNGRGFALNTNYKFGPYAVSNMTGSNAASYNFFLDLFVKGEGGGIQTVATPTFTPAAGTYYETQNVTISCSTDGAVIHYTLDGTDPTEASPVYNEALVVDESTTIKAMAVKDGYNNSAIAEASYNIQQGVVAIFNQDWEGEMNGWTFVAVSGETQWTVASYANNHYAYANGYNKPASEAWCISPAFNLNNYDNPVLSFKTATKFNGPVLEVLFSNDYDGVNPSSATWNSIPCALSTGDYAWVESGDIDMSVYNGTNCYIAYKYTNTDENAAGWEVDDCLLVGNTSIPVISATPLTLSGFSYLFENGPSAEQSFAVSGMNLTSDITITEADDFEISLFSGDDFGAQAAITLTPSNGNVSETLVYVRMKSGLEPGQYDNEMIVITSEDANSVNVTCNGTVMEPVGPGNDYVRIAEAGLLADGNRVILAARFNENATSYKAIANTLSSGKLNTTDFTSVMNGDQEIIPVTLLTSENEFYWTVNATADGFTFTNAEGNVISYGNSGTNFTMNGEKTEWLVSFGTSEAESMVPNYSAFTIINATTTSRAFAINANYVCGAYATSNMSSAEYNFYLDIFMQGEGGTPVVAAPTFSPAAGTYYEAQEVSLSCATAEADVFYSLESENGPWTAYAEAIVVDEDMTIWAYATKDDYEDSPVVSADYIIQDDLVIIFNQDWENDWNGWSQVSVEGETAEWTIASYNNNHYAYMNAYNQGVNEDWLISPAFDLNAYEDVVLSFRSAMNYNGPDVEVFFSNDYDGQDPTTASWQALSCDLSQGSWTWTESGAISLDGFDGSNCFIAFKYVSTETEAAGWEIDDIMLTSGTNTDPSLLATPNAINDLTYVYGEGPSIAVTYQLTANNLVGEGEILVLVTEGFEVSLDDENYGDELEIAYADGSLIDEPVTVYVRLVEGLEIGAYDGVVMHEGGEAYAEVNLAGSVVSADQPAIDAFMPMYIQGNNGTNNNRVPVAIAVYLENLEPSTTYRYTNQFVDGNDGATVAGAGNVIYANGNGFYRTTSPSLSTKGSYGEFTTDESGEGFAWFINEPTANTRFTPGNHVYLRIRVNDGHDGTDAAYIFTTEDYATVLNFGTENDANQGTAFYAKSSESPMSFAMMFSNDDDFRPTYSTPIETTGVDYGGINQYADFYKDEVAGRDGYFGGILPNVNDEGINIIWILDMESYVVNDFYAEGGEWGTAQTTNPQGGLNDIIFIDLTDTSVNENKDEANLSIWNNGHEIIIENMDDISYDMVVFNVMGQAIMSGNIAGISSQRISHSLRAGLYLVTMQSKAATITRKVIVR